MLSNLNYQKTTIEKESILEIISDNKKDKKLSQKKLKEEKKKLVFLLLNRAEKKFALGKFNESFNDCLQSEKIALEINMESDILAQ
jgi:hypothetical protein